MEDKKSNQIYGKELQTLAAKLHQYARNGELPALEKELQRIPRENIGIALNLAMFEALENAINGMDCVNSLDILRAHGASLNAQHNGKLFLRQR